MAASIQIVSPTPETPYNVATGTYTVILYGKNGIQASVSVRRDTNVDMECGLEVSKAGKSYIYIM